MGHDNVEDIYTLIDHAVRITQSEHDLTNCETCHLSKSKKLPVPKDSGTRASEAREVVHNNKLEPIHPEAIDGLRSAIGLVDSLSRYQNFFEVKG